MKKLNLEQANRRRFLVLLLKGLAATPILASGCSFRRSGLENVKDGMLPNYSGRIDVHCHVFNASDLPVEGFVRRVVLGDGGPQAVLEARESTEAFGLPALATFLVDILGRRAISARREADQLKNGVLEKPRDNSMTAEERRILERAVSSLSAAPMPPPPGSEAESIVLPIAESTDALLNQIYAEIGKLRPSREEEFLATPEVAEGLFNSDGTIGRNVRWALMLLRSRQQIVQEIKTIYGSSGKTVLFTPALIDFSQWLGDEPESPLQAQVEVMDLIQRLQVDGPMLHCFAPFDPWRQVVDQEAGQRPTALEIVQHAIMDAGFIGVKLYPPMGFLPAGNEGSGLSYPKRAGNISNFTRKIDNALESLFTWCEQNSVPVMAHAANSNGSNVRYGQRADPNNWASVLRAHPKLHLNLGHFGGFDQAIGGGSPESTWEWSLGKLAKTGEGMLYADMSYLSEILGPQDDPDIRPRLRKLLHQFIQEYDPQMERLMYGSDWSMLGREPEYKEYPGRVHQLLTAIGATEPQLKRFHFSNAADFLGIKAGQPARLRLEEYYKRYNLNNTRLAAIDI